MTPPVSRSTILIFAAWMTFALINATQVFVAMLHHGHSYLRMVAYNVCVWSLWAFITLAVVELCRRKPLIPFRVDHLLRHILAALVFAVVHLAAWTTLTIVMRPYDDMGITSFGRNFAAAVYFQLKFELFIYLIVAGITHAAFFYTRFVARERQTTLLESELNRAKLQALELQLRPHFLFNTMNAIGALVRTKRNDQALDMLVRLSELLRDTLDSGDVHEVSLEQELKLFRKYVEIEQVRFSDRLSVAIDVTSDSLSARVPPLILQPLAENAIRHGVASVAGPAHLELRARRDDGILTLDVFNTGPALPTEIEHGVGLTNTVRRLEQLYGPDASLQLLNAGNGVISRLIIPAREEVR